MSEFRETSLAAHSASRRHILRGVGSLITLPFLESLGARSFAAEAPKAAVKPAACRLALHSERRECERVVPHRRRQGLRALLAQGPRKEPRGLHRDLRPDAGLGALARQWRWRSCPRRGDLSHRLHAEKDRRLGHPARHLRGSDRGAKDRPSHPSALARAEHRWPA
jgi:hypothetical protein